MIADVFSKAARREHRKLRGREWFRIGECNRFSDRIFIRRQSDDTIDDKIHRDEIQSDLSISDIYQPQNSGSFPKILD